MDKKTAEMISKFLTDEGLAPDHVQYAAERKFSDEAMGEVAKKCALSDLETKELASTVKGMREGTQRVAPLPTPVTAPTDGGSEVTEVPDLKPPRSPWVKRVLATMGLVALMVLVAMVVNTCFGQKDAVSNSDFAKLKADVDKIKTDEAVTNAGIVALHASNFVTTMLVDTLQKDKADLSALQKLDEKVDLMDKKHDLVEEKLDGDITKLWEELAKKADKADLDRLATKYSLHVVVKSVSVLNEKLDAHIAADEAEEATPTTLAPPTHKVTIQHVPVYVDVYKQRRTP